MRKRTSGNADTAPHADLTVTERGCEDSAAWLSQQLG
jgi:hypothetical protein